MRYALAVVVAAVVVAVTTVAFIPSKKEKADNGWVKLFNGTSTTGWHTWKLSKAGAAWKADNGMLHLDPTVKEDRGDLVSNEAYDNFDLKLQWKISSGGNSGVIFYASDDSKKYDDTYNTGPEMQVLDNDKHPDGKIPKHRAGNLYDLIAGPDNVKPVGEWNDMEIVANKGSLKLYLNGTNVVTTTMWDDNWRKMIAGSKFKEWPDFGTFKKGHIVLQDHGNEVWYQNVMIKKL